MNKRRIAGNLAMMVLGGAVAVTQPGCANMNAYDVGGAVIGGPIGSILQTKGQRDYIDQKIDQLTRSDNEYCANARSRYTKGVLPKNDLIFACNRISDEKEFRLSATFSDSAARTIFDRNCLGVKDTYDKSENITLGWQVKHEDRFDSQNHIVTLEEAMNGSNRVSVIDLKNYAGRFMVLALHINRGALNLGQLEPGEKKATLAFKGRALAETYFRVIDKENIAPTVAKQIQVPTKPDIIRALKDITELKEKGTISEEEFKKLKDDLMKNINSE